MNKYILLILLLCCIFPQCNRSIDSHSVDYIKFYSLPREMERVCSIISGDELIKWNDRVDDLPILCRDTTITSKEEINTFVREVNNMKKAKGHQSIDIRTMAVIHMTSGSEIQICFGSRFSTTKNGVYFEDNPNLFEFVNEIIYSPHDFYYWAGKMTKYVLEHPE